MCGYISLMVECLSYVHFSWWCVNKFLWWLNAYLMYISADDVWIHFSDGWMLILHFSWWCVDTFLWWLNAYPTFLLNDLLIYCVVVECYPSYFSSDDSWMHLCKVVVECYVYPSYCLGETDKYRYLRNYTWFLFLPPLSHVLCICTQTQYMCIFYVWRRLM